jgi:hypothetical protein
MKLYSVYDEDGFIEGNLTEEEVAMLYSEDTYDIREQSFNP